MVAKTKKGCAWSKSKRKKPAKRKKKNIVFKNDARLSLTASDKGSRYNQNLYLVYKIKLAPNFVKVQMQKKF